MVACALSYIKFKFVSRKEIINKFVISLFWGCIISISAVTADSWKCVRAQWPPNSGNKPGQLFAAARSPSANILRLFFVRRSFFYALSLPTFNGCSFVAGSAVTSP